MPGKRAGYESGYKIQTHDLEDLAATQSKLAADSVATAKVVDRAVTQEKLDFVISKEYNAVLTQASVWVPSSVWTSTDNLTATMKTYTDFMDFTDRPTGTSHGILVLAQRGHQTARNSTAGWLHLDQQTGGAPRARFKNLKLRITLDGSDYDFPIQDDSGTDDSGDFENFAYRLDGLEAINTSDYIATGPWWRYVSGLTNNQTHSPVLKLNVDMGRTNFNPTYTVELCGMDFFFIDLGMDT